MPESEGSPIRSDRLRIAMIGTRGVPARYGGFETCVEEVGRRLAGAGHQVRVFCRPTGEASADVAPTYLGMQLVHLPVVRKRALETLMHTALSVVHPSLKEVHCAILFNAANAPLLPVLRLRGIPVATHVDGLEWRRAKWGPTGRRYYRAAEALAVRWSDALIADAAGIQDYYRRELGASTELITYGAPVLDVVDSARIAEFDLRPRGYHLVVARFEPENHVLEIVQGYVRSGATLPLVVVGSAPYADEYTARVAAAADGRVRLLGSVWDQEQLDQLYAHAQSYLHGHSVGGTNPSLLRASGAGAYVVAYDSVFNREVLEDLGAYFRAPDDVARLIEWVEINPHRAAALGSAGRERMRRYDWDEVAGQYEALCQRLSRGISEGRPTGRRVGVWTDDPSSGAPDRDRSIQTRSRRLRARLERTDRR